MSKIEIEYINTKIGVTMMDTAWGFFVQKMSTQCQKLKLFQVFKYEAFVFQNVATRMHHGIWRCIYNKQRYCVLK